MNNSTIGGNKRKLANALAMTGLIIIFIAYMFPFIMVVINALKEKRDIIKDPFSWLFTVKGLSFDNFVKAFTQMDFLNAFKNSLIVTVSATVLVTLLAAMLAYYIVRHNNKVSKIMFALMVASMIIPFQAIMIPLVSIYGGTLNVLNHRVTLIFMHVGFSMAMSVFMFHGFIKGNIPIALEEAAYIDGCNHAQIFFKIVFPLLKPIISTMVILNSLAFWNDYLLPSLQGAAHPAPVHLQLLRYLLGGLRHHHGRTAAVRHPHPHSVCHPPEADHRRRGVRRGEIKATKTHPDVIQFMPVWRPYQPAGADLCREPLMERLPIFTESPNYQGRSGSERVENRQRTSESTRELDQRPQRVYLLQGRVPPLLPVFPLRTPLGHHALGPCGEP